MPNAPGCHITLIFLHLPQPLSTVARTQSVLWWIAVVWSYYTAAQFQTSMSWPWSLSLIRALCLVEMGLY